MSARISNIIHWSWLLLLLAAPAAARQGAGEEPLTLADAALRVVAEEDGAALGRLAARPELDPFLVVFELHCRYYGGRPGPDAGDGALLDAALAFAERAAERPGCALSLIHI